jgi:hypothetical protein
MLGAARRFADAYLVYEGGRLPGWVRDAIVDTAVPTLARSLLAHPVRLAAVYLARRRGVPAYRVLSVTDTGGQSVGISYVDQQSQAQTGAFLVRLARARRRWLVARVEL